MHAHTGQLFRAEENIGDASVGTPANDAGRAAAPIRRGRRNNPVESRTPTARCQRRAIRQGGSGNGSGNRSAVVVDDTGICDVGLQQTNFVAAK